MTTPAYIQHRLGPVVPGLANRPGGVWDVTQRGVDATGRTDVTARLSVLAAQAHVARAALYFPAGRYWIAHWPTLGTPVAGVPSLVGQRWIGAPGSILYITQGLSKSKAGWHGAWFSGITFAAPNASGEKLFGGGSHNLYFDACTIQDCAPAFLDGPTEWVTFYACRFTSTSAYTQSNRSPTGYGPCTGQIQQTVGNVGQHFTVAACAFQFAPHGQSGALIQLEGSGLIGDYLITDNDLLTDELPDYLVDAGIDVEPHQPTPITDVTITNNRLANTRIYIAGVTNATIYGNDLRFTAVGMHPAPYHPPFCGNVDTGKHQGKTTEPGLGQAILGYTSYAPNKPPAGTITIQQNTITYTAQNTTVPPVPFFFSQGGRIDQLIIADNIITQPPRAVSVVVEGQTFPPCIAYLEPGLTTGGWGSVVFRDNTIFWDAVATTPLVQANLAQGDTTRITIQNNTVHGLDGPVAHLVGYDKNTNPGVTGVDQSIVNGNIPAAANTVVRTFHRFKPFTPGVSATAAWYTNPLVWGGAATVGALGYGVWARTRCRWPFGSS